jgi:hypothetical protein
MYFFADFKSTSQDILEEVGQEVDLKYEEKDAKSETLFFWDRFIFAF